MIITNKPTLNTGRHIFQQHKTCQAVGGTLNLTQVGRCTTVLLFYCKLMAELTQSEVELTVSLS